MTDDSPTAQEKANAHIRQEVAERFQREYEECLHLAEQLFGPGWMPSHRHFLLDKDDEDRCRRTGEKPLPAATVFTLKNDVGQKRHFTMSDGKPVECASIEEGFGPMLLEPHPTRGFEHSGKFRRIHRYSLCWSGYELYHPKSAEWLAAARAKREQKAIQKDAETHPLFAEQIRSGELHSEKKPSGRSTR